MEAFDVLGDPVRRRILELLADGEQSSGEVTEAISAEFGIGQPAGSMQLRVLRRFNGFAEVRRQRQGETLADLLYGAVTALEALRGREHLVRYVLYARGVPVVTPYPENPVHELAARCGLAGANTKSMTLSSP